MKLCVEPWEETLELSANDLAQRLIRHFPSAVVDAQRGDAHVREILDRLICVGAQDEILASHRSYFGNVVFASVSEARWEGATATSYLHRMWPTLGDAVFFDVEGAAGAAAVGVIARELGEALGMVPCAEVTEAVPGAAPDPERIDASESS